MLSAGSCCANCKGGFDEIVFDSALDAAHGQPQLVLNSNHYNGVTRALSSSTPSHLLCSHVAHLAAFKTHTYLMCAITAG